MNVNGKVAVVTGGASGIGLALCTRFAKEGADVVCPTSTRKPVPSCHADWVLEKFAVKARDYDEYIAMIRAGRVAETARVAGAA